MFNSNYGNDSGMPSASQFGAAGGFMPSPAPDAGQASQGAKRYTNSQTLRAVTIKQLLKAVEISPDDTLKVDGADLHNISLVGRVLSVSETDANLVFQLDDGTGRLEVKLFKSEEDEQMAAKRQECREGAYVRIYGQLRPFDGSKSMVAFTVKAVTDFNEVTYHFLSVIYQHAHFTQGAGRSGGAGPSSVIPNPAMAMKSAAPAGAAAGGSNPLHSAIMNVFNSADKDFGVEEIVQALSGRYDPAVVRDAVVQVADEGEVYSTTENHYKSCSRMG